MIQYQHIQVLNHNGYEPLYEDINQFIHFEEAVSSKYDIYEAKKQESSYNASKQETYSTNNYDVQDSLNRSDYEDDSDDPTDDSYIESNQFYQIQDDDSIIAEVCTV